MESGLLIKKLEHIEKDINSIRAIIKEKPSGKKVSLKGMLRGVEISTADIEEAKKGIFKHS